MKADPVKMFSAGIISAVTGFAASLITDALFNAIFEVQAPVGQSIVSSLIYFVFSLLFVTIYVVIVLREIRDEIREVHNGFFYVLGALVVSWALAQADWRQWIDFVLIIVSYVAYLAYNTGLIRINSDMGI